MEGRPSLVLASASPARLATLRSAGFIDFRRDGKFNYYRLDANGFAELMATLFPDGTAPRLTFGALEVNFRGN